MTKFLTQTGRFSLTQENVDGSLDARGVVLAYDSDDGIYPAGSIVEKDGKLYKANTDVNPVEFPFVEGADSDQWVAVAGAGGGIAAYDSDATYEAGDLVLKDNTIYVANARTAGDNPVFEVGSDSDKWNTVSQHFWSGGDSGQMLGDGSGNVYAPLDTTWGLLSATNGLATTGGMIFTAPVSGKYKVHFEGTMYWDGSDMYKWVGFSINGADPTEQNSRFVRSQEPASYFSEETQTLDRIMDLNAGDTVQMMMKKTTSGGGGNGDTNDFKYWNDTDNTRKSLFMSYERIGDYIPAIGLKAEYGSYQPTERTTVGTYSLTALEGNKPVQGASAILLKAGVTYELMADLEVRATYAVYRWKVDNTTFIGNSGVSASSTSTDAASETMAYAYYTPTQDVYVRLELTGLANYSTTYVASSVISVKAIAGNLPIYKDYQANFLSATRTTAQSVAPGAAFICDVVEENQNISYNTANGQITLKAGVTYELIGDYGHTSYNNVAGNTQWYNVTASEWIGSFQNILSPNMNISDPSSGAAARAIITPTVDTIVEFRRFGTGATANFGFDQGDSQRGYPNISVKSISNRLPLTNADTLGGLNDVDVSSGNGVELQYNESSGKWEKGGRTGGYGSLGSEYTSPDGAFKIRNLTDGDLEMISLVGGAWDANGHWITGVTSSGNGKITLQSSGTTENANSWTFIHEGAWPQHGGLNVVHLHNKVAHRMYRITMMIDGSYQNNPIVIECLL